MKTQKTWLTETDSSQFGKFLDTLWAHLKNQHPDLPDKYPEGVGELPGRIWPIGFAVDSSSHFAAFQWHTPAESESSAASGVRVESFFVCPTSSNPKIGLRVLSPETELSDEIMLPTWWSESFSTLEVAKHTLPGFLELAGVLASKGAATSGNAALFSHVAELTHELSYYKGLAEDQSEELRRLRVKARDLWTVAQTASTSIPDSPDEVVPAEEIRDLSGLPEWAEKNADRIVIHSRALNASKKSLYENPATVYVALELLAGAYREHRLGLVDKNTFSEQLAEAGLQFAGSVAANVAGSQGDDYFINWEGRRRFLEFHLLKGGGRDERFCLRIYFFWDEPNKKVVVGWLPSHLSNSLS